MTAFVLRTLANAVALALAVRLVDGVEFQRDWWMMVFVALIFGFVNALVKPVVKLFSLPFIIITLGLFTLVINGLMLGLTAWFSDIFNLGLTVGGFWPALKGALVVSVASAVFSCFIPDGEEEKEDDEGDKQ